MVKSTPIRSGRHAHSDASPSGSANLLAIDSREPLVTNGIATGERVDDRGRTPTSSPPDRESLNGPGRRGRIAASLAVLGVYVAIGLAAFWPDLPHISRDLFSQATLGDPQLALWLLAWVQYAVPHGINPFFSHAIFVPTGLNLGVNTAAPLLGFITAPLTLFVGPVAIINLIVVAAMPLSAASAFFVLRKWNVWLPAAAIGGLIYGS
jgi:hypothetical protein